MSDVRKSSLQRLTPVVVSVVLLLAACSIFPSSPKQPIKFEVTAPTANAQVNVGQSLGIQGLATADAISKVDVVIDNELYATLTAPDQTKGVSSFPVTVPWTPKAAGTHVVVMKAFGPDDKVIVSTDPLIITAKSLLPPTPAPQPTVPAPPTQAAQIPAQNPAATTVPAAAPTTAAAELTVVNEFARVRSGPDTAYTQLGQLSQNDKATVKGKSADGKWWQIVYKDGVGWVFGDLVKANDAAKTVPVASAPPLPTQAAAPAAPAPPSGNVLATLPTAPVVSAAPAPTTAPAAARAGGRGILTIDQNPVSAGGTVYASWNIPSFRDGSFDKGDGGGLKGPIAGSMRVEVPYVASQRTLTLQWNDTNGSAQSDTIVIAVTGSAPAGATTGGRGILRLEANPIGAGGTAYATWNIPSFREGSFDKGDGAGLKGPIAANMRVDISGVTNQRSLLLRWIDTNGAEQTDTIVLSVSGTAPAASADECNASNPYWRGRDPSYPFCVKTDLEWNDGGQSNPRNLNFNQDQQYTLKWNVFGINGITLHVDPNSQFGPAGNTGRSVPINGSSGSDNATYTFNGRDFGGGCYKWELYIVRKDGKEVGHNEKFMCVK